MVKKICDNCGKKYDAEVKIRKYCSYHCARIARRVVERPSAKTLEKLVRNNPWEKVARMYEVSSYTIRKWVKYYGLNINKPKPQDISCPTCGETFKQKHLKHKYCSLLCVHNRDKAVIA